MKRLVSVLLGLALGAGISGFDLYMWKEYQPVLYCQLVIKADEIDPGPPNHGFHVIGFGCLDWSADDLRHFIKEVRVE